MATSAKRPGQRKRGITRLRVQRSEWLTPHMIRIVLGGEVPVLRGQRLHRQVRQAAVPAARRRVPRADRPGRHPQGVPSRAVADHAHLHSPRYDDADAGELAIDFVTHGDEGFAAPWAMAAQPGDEVIVRGPGGAYAPSHGRRLAPARRRRVRHAGHRRRAGGPAGRRAGAACSCRSPTRPRCRSWPARPTSRSPGCTARTSRRQTPPARHWWNCRAVAGFPARRVQRVRARRGRFRGRPAAAPDGRARRGEGSAVHLGLLAPRQERGRLAGRKSRKPPPGRSNRDQPA